MSTTDHFEHLMRLMALEAKAEEEQLVAAMQRYRGKNEERTGNCLLRLVIRDEVAGLGGRVLVTLAKRNQQEELPWHRLGVGTPILLSTEGAGESWRGVVSQQNRVTIQVALNDWPEMEDERATFRLDLSSDEVARQRQRQALERAQIARGDRLAELRDILLGQQSPLFNRPESFTFLNSHLDESQRQAVDFALTAQDLAIVHGPPGTGKTTALVEIIRQAVQRGETVLACAPSNMAVDNLFEKLLAAGEKVLRLGHPARVMPELREHTLDLLVENNPDVRQARKLASEGHKLREQAGKETRAHVTKSDRQTMRAEAKEMLADARRMEEIAVERILDSARVLCATTTGLDRDIIGTRRFDLYVLDEAAQSTEPATWIPLLWAKRLVLAGDPCQLPPTVISLEAAAQGFNISLMERLMAHFGETVSRQLTTQYRMHEDIMTFSSDEFYNSTLQADEQVIHHLLPDLPAIVRNELTETAVHFIDTAGASYDEELEPDGESRLNPLEAALVVRKVTALLAAGVKASDIGVITPYSAQVRFLREEMKQPDVEINSVDGFQGREKEVIIISLVRSNIEGEIGFLGDTRRMNVALTRARRKLIVIGDSATITVNSFYQRLVTYFERIGAYHSVWEETE